MTDKENRDMIEQYAAEIDNRDLQIRILTNKLQKRENTIKELKVAVSDLKTIIQIAGNKINELNAQDPLLPSIQRVVERIEKQDV